MDHAKALLSAGKDDDVNAVCPFLCRVLIKDRWSFSCGTHPAVPYWYPEPGCRSCQDDDCDLDHRTVPGALLGRAI